MKVDYRYRFHPSILGTNRQIAREASHVLYTENLLVRINSSGQSLSEDSLHRTKNGDTVPILASKDYAKRFTRHVMEVVMLQDFESPFELSSCHSETCFVIASDDIPRLCWNLLSTNTSKNRTLSQLTLAVEVRHDMDVSDINGDPCMENQDKTQNQVYKEGGAAASDKTSNNSNQTSIECTQQQTYRLLEPLRRLHSLQAVHIEGPVGEHYKVPLVESMCRPGPTEKELFDVVLAMFEDARTTYDTGNLSSAVSKMKHTLDTMDDYKNIAQCMFDPLLPIWDAYYQMRFVIWTNLGWASLKSDNIDEVEVAFYCAHVLLSLYVGEDADYWMAPPMGHEIAMTFYMWTKVWEASDDLGDHDQMVRSYCLREVVDYLQEGLRHEPRNELLGQQLRRREEELQKAIDLEDLERGVFAPSAAIEWWVPEVEDEGKREDDGEDEDEDGDKGEDEGKDDNEGENEDDSEYKDKNQGETDSESEDEAEDEDNDESENENDSEYTDKNQSENDNENRNEDGDESEDEGEDDSEYKDENQSENDNGGEGEDENESENEDDGEGED